MAYASLPPASSLSSSGRTSPCAVCRFRQSCARKRRLPNALTLPTLLTFSLILPPVTVDLGWKSEMFAPASNTSNELPATSSNPLHPLPSRQTFIFPVSRIPSGKSTRMPVTARPPPPLATFACRSMLPEQFLSSGTTLTNSPGADSPAPPSTTVSPSPAAVQLASRRSPRVLTLTLLTAGARISIVPASANAAVPICTHTVAMPLTPAGSARSSRCCCPSLVASNVADSLVSTSGVVAASAQDL
mmetsp:Transcript_3308/g.7958  ORF Transcript_3308/g.7958 Transcript_3308/m.7958 type:complete len:245 (+) Transcript_3308:2540-3274(+)|eukprot:746772-Hanusia_phi.AAC.3